MVPEIHWFWFGEPLLEPKLPGGETDQPLDPEEVKEVILQKNGETESQLTIDGSIVDKPKLDVLLKSTLLPGQIVLLDVENEAIGGRETEIKPAADGW